MPKYLSGRVKRTPQSALTDDRYQYLGLEQAEPNLGDSPSGSGTPNVPAGQQFQVVSVLSNPGERYWVPVTGGVIPGSISVFEEGSLVGSLSSITQLNFVGNSLTAVAEPFIDGVSPGNIATITAAPPGPNGSVLFKDDDFATSTDLVFNGEVGILTVGKGIDIGIGGTIMRVKTSGGDPYIGINETNPTQELHVNGDVRITGTIYDSTNDPGTPTDILTKGSGGLEWTSQSAIQAGAGGSEFSIQFHNSAGLIDGAANAAYDSTNQRIGIGITQPRVDFDVVGLSSFTGGLHADHLYVTGISTYLANIDAQGGIKANTAQVIDLPDKSVVFVTSDGELSGTANLQFTGSLFEVKGESEFDNVNISGVVTSSQLVVTGVGTIGSIEIDTNKIYANSGNLLLEAQGGTVQSNDKVFINNTQPSAGKDSGALVVDGGVGIEQDLHVGGQINVSGASTLAADGGVTKTGGDLYVGQDLHVDRDFYVGEAIFGSLTVSPGPTNLVNFRSSGVSTFASKVHVLDSQILHFGGADHAIGDLQIFHDTFHSYISDVSTGTGNLRITGNKIDIRSEDNVERMALFDQNNAVELYFNNVKRLETSGIGITVTGTIESGNIDVTGTLAVSNTTSLNGNVNLGDADTDNIVFKGKVNSDIIPNSDATKDLGSQTFQWRKLYAKSVIGVDDILIDNLDVNGIATFRGDWVDFDTEMSNNTGTGTTVGFGTTAYFNSGAKTYWGDDLEIYHFNDNYIRSTVSTSDLFIESASGIYLRTDEGNETSLRAITNEGIDLYFDGSRRLTTYNEVTSLNANGLVGAGVSIFEANNVNNIKIKSPNSLLADYSLTLPPNDGDDGDLLKTDGDGNLQWIAQSFIDGRPGGDDEQVQYNNNGALGGMQALTYDNKSHDIVLRGPRIGVSTLGVTSAYWHCNEYALTFNSHTEARFIGIDTSKILSIYGENNSFIDSKNNDLHIRLTSTNANQQIKIKPTSNHDGITVNYLNSVDLYYNNSKKFSTSVNGIKPHGAIEDRRNFVGLAGSIMTSTGTGIEWVSPADSGAGTPGGTDTQIQFNDDDVFGGVPNLVFNKDTTKGYFGIPSVDFIGSTEHKRISWQPQNDSLNIMNNVYLVLGTGGNNNNNWESRIYHTGNATIWDSSQGGKNLTIQGKNDNTSTQAFRIKPHALKESIIAVANDLVSLYYNGNECFKTTQYGVKIIGGLQDKDNSLGSSTKTQVLSSTGTELKWIDASSGSLTEIKVDYTGRSTPCTLPITISEPEVGVKQINIPDNSNAFGTKYVQDLEPTGNEVCDGDIWYDTST